MPCRTQTSDLPTLDGSHAGPVERRLLKAGLAMWLFLATAILSSMAGGVRTSLVGGVAGDDLIPSYMAGSFVRRGRADLLMDYPAAVRFQADLRRSAGLEQHGRTGPWLNPPFYAWLFVPLAGLPYRQALVAAASCNGLMLAVSIALLCRLVPGGWRRKALVPLLLLPSMPMLQTASSQQNTFLSLLILTAAVTQWRAGHALRAGAIAGLLLFKPQLAVIVAAGVTVGLGRRAAYGWLLTATTLLALTCLTLPGGLTDYFAKLPTVLPWLHAGRPYAWERQATLQGFWRLLIQGRTTGPALPLVTLIWLATAVPVGAALAAIIVRRARFPFGSQPLGPLSQDRLIGAGILSMPLLMPYFMDYDLLLMVIPAVLFAAEMCRGEGVPACRDREGAVCEPTRATLNPANASAGAGPLADVRDGEVRAPNRAALDSASTSAGTRPLPYQTVEKPKKRRKMLRFSLKNGGRQVAVTSFSTVCHGRGSQVALAISLVDWAFLGSWALLYPLLFVNAAIGSETRVSLTVPLLAAMTALAAARFARPMENMGRIAASSDKKSIAAPIEPSAAPSAALERPVAA